MLSRLEKILGSDKLKLLENTAKFSIIEEITITPSELGRGSYGTVYAAVYSSKPCVAKEMHPFLKHDKLETFVREINTLSTLKHPSIVQFLGVYFRDKSHVPILVMERMWKNLCTLLEEQPNQLALLTKMYILNDIACGLQYLHSQKKPVVHRDLHPSNVLLNENLSAKIADLGQAKPLDNVAAQKLSTAPGNIAYMAPETLTKKPTYDTKLDIFSLGCTMIHLVTETFPSPADQFVQSENLYRKVSEAERRIEYLNLMKHTSVLQHIAHQCLEDAPTSRPVASEICKELEKYIHKLESESPTLAKQHNQDKFSLLKLLRSQDSQLESKSKIIEDLNKDKDMLEDIVMKKDDYISSLQSQLEEIKEKFEKVKFDNFSLERERDSLDKKLADQSEVNKQLTETYKNQMNLLREDVKTKQEEIEVVNENKLQMQKEINNLQDKLKEEKSVLSQKMQLISDLENDMQKINADAEHCKQERDKLSKANSSYALTVKSLEQQINQLQSKLEEKDKQIEVNATEKDSIIADLNEKLKTQEHQVTQNVAAYKEYKSKYTSLEQEYKALQEKYKNQQVEGSELNPVCKKIGDTPGSQLQQKLLELQSMNEKELQQLQRDRQKLIDTFKQQHAKVAAAQAQLLDSKKKSAALKQQLEEKSYRLSTLGSSLNELQESFSSKEEKLKSSEEDIATLKKQLDNNDKIQRSFEKDLKSKEESLKRKEQELELQKKEHADEINNLHDRYKREINDLREDIERYKAQIDSQGEISSLLKKEAEFKSDLEKSTKDRFQTLDNERKSLSRSEKELKRLIKYRDADIKEKAKKIESLEKGFLNGHSHGYNYDVHWYPYLSLPTKLIRPSVAIFTDKVFVTGGYQSTNPQDMELEDYLQTLEDKNSTFCFNLAKCRCDTIDSPVKLGALASVNGQCVLVGGADSVGNTLTGNVYVLCEEESHDQWKDFSKPLPIPRILACACCYVNRWLIVCGGFASKSKEESSLLEAISLVEILDTTKGEWYTLSEENCPNFSTILCCAVVGEDVYVVGSDQVIKTSCNKLIKAATSNNTLVWDNVQIETEESNGKLYPFSVVEVTGEPMIIASMTDGEDDVTCVLMKDTRGRWRIMSKAVECQHCSAAVVTSSLELLLFGGSEKTLVDEATDISQKGNFIPTLNIIEEASVERTVMVKSLTPDGQQIQDYVSFDSDVPITVNQPPNLFFTGPVHTIQFDHNGGMFQSPIHRVSLVVPPNALSDGEKVTVYMGATTSGPFDFPEDCKLRSAVVWLSVSPSDVVFKRNISVVVPHSAIFTSHQHHSMMRFVICEDWKGPKYQFSYSYNKTEIDAEQGAIELNEFSMVAIIATPEFTHDPEDEGVAEGYDSEDDFQDAPDEPLDKMAANGVYHRQRSSPVQKNLQMPPACYLAKLFWPHGELPSSFRVDIFYLQCLPTELYKVETLYRNTYYEVNGSYPEIVETQFRISGNGADLQCSLPCDKSSRECDCLSAWDVNQMNDINEVSIEKDKKYSLQYKNDPMRFSFKFSCLRPDSTCSLTCCFEFLGVDQVGRSKNDQLPVCLQRRSHPFILEKGIYHSETADQQVDEDEAEVENIQDKQ